MKTAVLVFVGMFPAIGPLAADGIPINEERTVCEAPHLLVRPGDSQKEELTTCGTLTLTTDQWEALRKLSPGMPKRIPSILPCTYNDCMCDMEGSYGIWFKDGSVAIVLEEPPAPFEEWTEDARKRLDPHLSFRMDERGQFYANERLMHYPEVKARVSHKATVAGESPSLVINLPPALDRNHPALASRIEELEQLAKAAGRDFWVFWSQAENPGD